MAIWGGFQVVVFLFLFSTWMNLHLMSPPPSDSPGSLLTPWIHFKQTKFKVRANVELQVSQKRHQLWETRATATESAGSARFSFPYASPPRSLALHFLCIWIYLTTFILIRIIYPIFLNVQCQPLLLFWQLEQNRERDRRTCQPVSRALTLASCNNCPVKSTWKAMMFSTYLHFSTNCFPTELISVES